MSDIGSVDNGKPRGAYTVGLEGRGADRDELANLKRAEDKAGIKTGARFLDGKEGVVSYLGYPKPRFYFQVLDRASGTYGDAVEIDKAVFDRMKTLSL